MNQVGDSAMTLEKVMKRIASLTTACLLICSLAQPVYAKEKKPKKVRKPGTGMMVTGIVFTPITGLATLLAIAGYQSAKNYNCDWGKDREDGTRVGEQWRTSRENCHKERKEQMTSSSAFGGAALVGLGLSITGIIVGANTRSSADTNPQVNLNYNTTGKKDWNLAFNFPIN
jgi:hypothetical protein